MIPVGPIVLYHASLDCHTAPLSWYHGVGSTSLLHFDPVIVECTVKSPHAKLEKWLRPSPIG